MFVQLESQTSSLEQDHFGFQLMLLLVACHSIGRSAIGITEGASCYCCGRSRAPSNCIFCVICKTPSYIHLLLHKTLIYESQAKRIHTLLIFEGHSCKFSWPAAYLEGNDQRLCALGPQCAGCREATLSTGITSSALNSCSSSRPQWMAL
ncbi:tetraspanin-4 isoform X9 [Passer domesticus]|uniref:tetraspanin-4 isoform X9 n=1 Tax=Passer domesticus TaxID=48849 RepID=UPI0030FE7693